MYLLYLPTRHVHFAVLMFNVGTEAQAGPGSYLLYSRPENQLHIFTMIVYLFFEL